MLQSAIRDSGAIEQVERIIAHNVKLAVTAVTDAPISAAAKDQLIRLADTVIQRTA